jgi:hypothetical protein
MLLWIGVALLAGSWLLGLDYFYPASPWAWLATVAAAVVLLSKTDDKPLAASQRRLDITALLLLLPVAGYAAWPYRAAPLLIVLGLAIHLLPVRRRWPDFLACGAITAGVVMFVQALTLELYACHTAWSHELPWPLPDMLAGIATLLGVDATATGSSVVMHSIRQVHRLGATWELLLDPATLLFFVGGLTLLALRGNHECGMTDGEENDEGNDEARMTNDEENDKAQMTNDESCRIRHSSFVLRPYSHWLRGARILTLIVLCWLPLRAGLMMAVYLQRVLRSDPDRPLHAMNHFFSPWMLLALLIVPVLLAWRFVGKAEGGRRKGEEDEELGTGNEEVAAADPASSVAGSSSPAPRLSPLAPISIGLAVALFTAAIYWNPVGARREGRVMVVERHSTWEPTTTGYDTKSFGEPSGYNYSAIYNYLGQYYNMSRLLEKDKIDDQTLANCDVLVIKIPATRYSQAEVDAVERFVAAGGGLLLVGDHTNFEGSGTIMNDMTRRMGFIFRDDLLFGFGASPYDQLYVPPKLPHPIVQHIPAMDFAVSCSIDPGRSRGRAVITNTGLWSMGPEYHHDNYHPFPQHCPEMRYGPFVQVWAAWHGQGRAVAFTDSTIFSNFCVFQPGKAELMLAMVEWLNHGNPLVDPSPWLLLLGLPLLAAGLWYGMIRSPHTPGADTGVQDGSIALQTDVRTRSVRTTFGLLLLAAGGCGWVVASLAVTAAHRWTLPEPECVRPMTRVVIDRTASTVPLSKGADTRGKGDGYGLLEQWIARTGCYTVRKDGPDAFSGDALVVICPNRSVTAEFREQLTQYVADGGRLLVIDSPENTDSTANSLLWPFGLSIHHDRVWKGKLGTASRLPAVDIAGAKEVTGGQPVGKLDKLSVVATAKHGAGSVMVIGFGSLWNDKRMGEHWMLEPNATVKARYEVLFALLGLWLEDKPLPAPPPPPAKKPIPALPLKESGPAGL